MRVSRTRGLLITAAVGALLATSACSGGDSSSSGSGSAKQLEVFSWWTSGSEDAGLKQLVAGFKAANPGVKVVNGAVAGGGGSNSQAVLQTRLQGNNPPDTWQTHPGKAIGEYINSGILADLTSVYDEDGLEKVVPKELVTSVSAKGKIYGVSTGAHRGNELWFNKKLLAAAGVEITASTTPEQFVKALGKLKDKGTTPLCVGAKDAFAPAQLFENTLLGEIGPDGWNKLVAGKSSWTSPEVKRAAKLFSQMLPYIDPDASALTWDQATKRLAAGECAVMSMGDWAYGELVKDGAKDGSDFGYVPEPGTDGSFIMVVDTFVVAENAKHREQGLKWASAISSKDVQLAFSKEKGSTPIRTDVPTDSLPAYQQAAADSFRKDSLLQSIVHGEAVSPQFQQSFYDAVTQFIQSKDVDSFVKYLASAATS
ncbi:extracellular solute-binding protein [Streptomyces fructofermentans]|uniref:ABC transporter substrate-binding protein n=1 Tax=Streptomyces fructofermentans TaxID=152141 RepID=UPI0033DC792C